MTTAFLGRLASIVLIDLVLSGDNALVVGMAAHRLPPRQRRWAILLGGAGAIVLRVLCTALAALLLAVPLLQASGGLLVGWIGYKLVREEGEGREIAPASSLWEAVQTIALADLVMSFDNMLAVGGAAHGTVELLVFGLFVSMPLIFFGSGLVALMLDRFRWFLWAGVAVLAFIGGRMIVDDPVVAARTSPVVQWPIVLGFGLVVCIAAGWPLVRRRWQHGAARSEGRRTRAS